MLCATQIAPVVEALGESDVVTLLAVGLWWPVGGGGPASCTGEVFLAIWARRGAATPAQQGAQ